ncbi:uncharacterized protein LOC117110407 [Anneissia japonica]|uniref:uncharacterized protein LOC117110407 n=1 Tax=Anneissia japonica TaxID=1529436 RepID=UPI00142560E8|nr:uncharacterized protein LOC117110407 [Anneissia japonica]
MNRNLIGISTPPIIKTSNETSNRVRPKSGRSRSGSTGSVKLPVIDKGSSASMSGRRSKLDSGINFPNIKPRLSTSKFVSKFPVTTAGEIGSRSTKTEYQLELYGRYAPNARGQHGILNLMKWPQQGL